MHGGGMKAIVLTTLDLFRRKNSATMAEIGRSDGGTRGSGASCGGTPPIAKKFVLTFESEERGQRSDHPTGIANSRAFSV